MNSPKLFAALKAELLGTFLLILLGDGVVASVVLLKKQADWIVITTGWGLAVGLGVFVAGRISGGHLNPAVTLALAVRREFPWSRVFPYIFAQVLGAFLGAMLVYGMYSESFREFEVNNKLKRGEMTSSALPDPAAGGAGVFCTFPAHSGNHHNFFIELVATAALIIGIRAVTDTRNANVPAGLQPLLIGTVVFAIGLSLGGLTGYALNPARDFGPRLAAFFLGWGHAVFESHDWYFWVPIAGPIVGAIIGGYLYDFFIARGLPEE